MTPTRAREALVAAAASLAWGLIVAVGAYGVLRTIQYFLYPDPNPRTLVWSAHAGYFWRAWSCAYAGGIAAFAAYLFARRRPASVARALVPATAVAAVVLALQAAVFP
jgi:hypothetical protein